MSRLEGGQRLLTCVMPKGVGLALLRRLADELGIATADLHSARGFSERNARGVFGRVEKDVLTVLASEQRSDELFLWMHREAEVSSRPGRFLYVTRLRGATPFHLPEGVPPEQA